MHNGSMHQNCKVPDCKCPTQVLVENMFPPVAHLEFLVKQAHKMKEQGEKLQDKLDEKQASDEARAYLE